MPGGKASAAKICCLVFAILVMGSWQRLSCEDLGLKIVTNYSPKEYNLQPQNWCILQDRRGLIYVGNHEGVLEYDGVTWRKIDIPNHTVRSMAIDDKGTIFIGGTDEIGYLETDKTGSLQYKSLLPYLDEDKRSFGKVWKTHAVGEGIYFQTTRWLFLWDHKAMKTVGREGQTFNASFLCSGEIYIRRARVGLLKLVKGSFEVLPWSERFASTPIFMMVPFDDRGQKLLIGTGTDGLYLFDGSSCEPFPTDEDDYIKEKQLKNGIRLQSGDFGLATEQGGLVIIDKEGRLRKKYSQDSGLQDDNVRLVFEDREGSLWLALNNGISKIEYGSPFSIYDRRCNLAVMVLAAARHQGDLYVGTFKGLFKRSADLFQQVAEISSPCWALLSIGDSLLAATSAGVFQITNEKREKVIPDTSYVLLKSEKMSERIWLGTRSGLIPLNVEDGTWRERKRIEIKQEFRSIVEDQEGSLWLGTLTQGVIRVDCKDISKPVATQYGDKEGLPPGEVHVCRAAGHVMFVTGEGLYRFDEDENKFVPDDTLGEKFAGGSNPVFRLVEDKQGNIWFHSDDWNYRAVANKDQTYLLDAESPLRIPPGQVNTIYPEGDIVWFGTHDGLIRYDTGIKKRAVPAVRTLIRRLIVNESPLACDLSKESPTLNYKERNLRFEFAAPFFEDESLTQYQYKLEPDDEKWSEWSEGTYKSYPHLAPGSYTFRVKGINVYGDESIEAAFKYVISTPWFITFWAFLGYILALSLLTFLLIKWQRTRMLEREKKRLEQLIKERTKEIQEKNRQLEEMDRIKSRFFANISHEFRTPLTLISGPLEQMLSQSSGSRQKKNLESMLRNSQHLLRLINQLLDLSKFESGKMKLQAGRQDIVPFLKGILASFESLAVQKKIDMKLSSAEEEIPIYFDAEKLEEAMANLLANAFKFTPPGGKVAIALTKESAGTKEFPAGFLKITVSDTGIGISADKLPHIFDRFFQADIPDEGRTPGTGIGLALVKEMIGLHRGTIAVQSEPGQGTEFTIRLPLGKGHLAADEIVTDAAAPSAQKAAPARPRPDVDIEEEAAESQEAAESSAEEGAIDKNIILVVDDNADVRCFIRQSLEPDYRVVEARDGREGIQQAKEIIPDLVISDIMMPELDGCALCRILKSEFKTSHIPIILLTAKATEESVLEGLETGADDYIIKPFNTQILLTRIKNLIELRRHLQEKFQRQMRLQPQEIEVSSMDEEFIEDILGKIEKNLGDPDFNVEVLQKKAVVGRTTLYRKVLALTGETPIQFIRSYRLKRAAQLLKGKAGNVAQVAMQVGFTNPAHFTKCFKEKFHVLPSVFQATESS